MADTDLRARIKEMLVKNLMLQTTADQIGDDLPLFGPNGLGLDSIDALELVVSMEKTFGVGIPNSEVAGKALRTVNTIHDYIVEMQAGKERAVRFEPERRARSAPPFARSPGQMFGRSQTAFRDSHHANRNDQRQGRQMHN